MPKRVPPLSARALAQVRPSDRPIELVDGYVPGLRVRILPNGTKTWSLNIRDSKGVRRRFDVGANLGIAEARKKAEALRRAVREGHDPTAQRRAARQRSQAAREGIGTLRALLEMYYAKGPGSDLRRAERDKQLLQTVFARILDKSMHDLDDTELQLIVDGWQSPSTGSLAVRLIRPCLKWAGKRGYARPNLAILEQPKTVAKRERVLTASELKSIWPHLNGMRGNVIKWLLWTGCRLGEATALPWAEIDGNKWVLPAARTKNGRQRVIPLSHQAMDLLATLGPPQPDALIFASTGGSALSNWDKSTKTLHAHTGTSGWHRHDLRRSVATMLGDLGFPPHVIGVVLGHANIAEGATAIYARSRYLPEHREALQALANEIDRIVADSDNVLQLVRRR